MDATFLSNKVILILTPQSWGAMKLAKHHYAMELAKRGNDVYYLNPPDNHHWSWSSNRIKINPVADHPNLFVIDQQLYFPYKLKFHSRKLYDKLIKKQISKILGVIPKPVDLIWSFDLGNLFPLPFFDKSIFKIFHPVDEPRDQQAIEAAQGADILFSVTLEILEKYKAFPVPAFFINHGLADAFLLGTTYSVSTGEPIKVGISGNLMRPDLDRKILLQIIGENPTVIFHFYGSFAIAQSNIGAAGDMATETFIRSLKAFSNVSFHGVLKTEELAKELTAMDTFLICYDINKDQSKGTNYHKVLEYISTGKVIVANNITTYQGMENLVVMTVSRENNNDLPALFSQVMQKLPEYNSELLFDERRTFAFNNTYKKQVSRINSILEDQSSH
jgi:glycosyltransferase involved in cell wall biosynthesis